MLLNGDIVSNYFKSFGSDSFDILYFINGLKRPILCSIFHDAARHCRPDFGKYFQLLGRGRVDVQLSRQGFF